MLKEFRMGSYLFRRLLNLIPILIGISFLSFVLINLSPSDPAEVAVRCLLYTSDAADEL